MQKPTLTYEQVIFWLERFRKLDVTKKSHRHRLIDSLLNSVYLFDDRMEINLNYKDGTTTIRFDEIEKSDIGSDLTALGAPKLNSLNLFTVGKMFGLFFFLDDLDGFRA